MNDSTSAIEFMGEKFEVPGGWVNGLKIKVARANLHGKVVGYNAETRHYLIKQLSGEYIVASSRFLYEAGYNL